ncbi:MAG: YdeI/OmpD-associated family protein [Chitinophagaceae bacterium]|nr:YdeI/OmpD-associated family protein [Chitinophagaceae bacterium]
MIQFKAIIKKYAQQGEKTGWTYIEINTKLAHQLKPNCRKSFRVKGKIDDTVINAVALIPVGDGNFILALNATIRKTLYKRKNDTVLVELEEDKTGYILNEFLMECLEDDPTALSFFNTLTKGHQNYFSKWIDSAKTTETQSKRIAMALNAFANSWDYGTMIRNNTKNK